MKESFVLYNRYLDCVEPLTMEERGVLLTAILCYTSGEELPEMSRVVKTSFWFIKSQLDADSAKYEETCKKRSDAGKKSALKKQQKTTKETNDNKSEQVSTNPTDNENDNDNDNENVIRYQQIADMYNDTCVSFPHLTKLSDRRRKAIRARLKAGYTIDDFQRLFELAESSEFLKGGNGRNWSATFDWMIQDGNMAKVLDGNYQSGEPTQKGENHDTGRKDTGYDKYLQDFIKSGGKIPEFTGF